MVIVLKKHIGLSMSFEIDNEIEQSDDFWIYSTNFNK